jgi:ADP-ribose pyrophosphatase YjhB (NUDIX family)
MEQEFGVVVAAVIFKGHEFLLGKRQSKDKNLPGYWSIPGGHVEVKRSDINILETNLVREIKEEVGISINNLQYLDSHSWVDSAKISIVFTCDLQGGEPIAGQETDEVGWFTLEKVKDLPLPPNVYRVLEKATKKF